MRRSTSASAMPHDEHPRLHAGGTAKYANSTAKTKMLSSDSERSIR